MGAVVLDSHPRAEGGLAETAQVQHAYQPLPVTPPRLQELEHSGVIGLAAGQRISDVGVVPMEVVNSVA
ncbi:hypothetical protein AUT26_14930 [[Arthrobacter] sp. ATCC 21022]|nr:hypothetical protein AUT26_14930 [Arthrobacter sp. ATCC 21022]KUR65126.1 hypothetical protein JM67_07545 [Arthrobacter sp. ATCC 21022]